MLDQQNVSQAKVLYVAMRDATLEDGWQIFVQVIKASTEQAFSDGQCAVIGYLENEDLNISRKDYAAMKELKPK
jgi:hypothetical protein